MKCIGKLMIVWCLGIACSSLPQIIPAGISTAAQVSDTCHLPFPKGKWQFLHSLEATLPGGQKGFLMGLTVISSSDTSIRSVMMTLEGLVVFDAQFNGQTTVRRAIPPFDSADFASGLIQDIQLIFFEPPGSLIESGSLKNGSSVCRHRDPGGGVVDIVTHPDDSWEIRQYRRDFRLMKTVKGTMDGKGDSSDGVGIPSRIELMTYGSPEYTLIMNLVEATPL
jgi:hypothetical protein